MRHPTPAADSAKALALRGALLGLALCILPPSGWAAGKPPPKKSAPAVKAPAEKTPAVAPASVTVVPLLGFGPSAALAADLTGVLFAELRGFSLPDVRIRKPLQPIAIACVTQLPCLAEVGRSVQAELLLVGVVGAKDAHSPLNLTLLLVRIPPGAGPAIPIKSASRSLDPNAPLALPPLQALVAELALAAGGKPPPPPPPPEPPSEASLLERINEVEAPPPAPVSSSDAPGGAGPAHSSAPAKASSPSPEPSPMVAKSQKFLQLLEDQLLQARESREREAKAQQEARLREKRNREEARAAEARRRRELQEARDRALVEERYARTLEQHRLTNAERLSKGLPPLPAPEPPPELKRKDDPAGPEAPPRATGPERAPEVHSDRPSQARLPIPEKKPGRPAPVPELQAPVRTTASDSPVYLESDGTYLMGIGAHGAGLAGYGLVGAGIELQVQPSQALEPLWLGGAYRSLHGFDPALEQWFYLHTAQVGALWRAGGERIHPFAGASVELLLLGKNLPGVGGTARAGMDLMVLDALGIRLDLALGGIMGLGIKESLGYPTSGQWLFRAGFGTTYRF